MLTYIKIDGFKSFHQFEMEFAPLTVITGGHGSGKSNLFEALHLLGRLAEDDLALAFRKQRGHRRCLFTQYDDDTYATEMEFTLEMLLNCEVKDEWQDDAILKYTRLRYQVTIKRDIDTDGFEDLYIVNERLESINPDDDSWVKKYIPKKTLNHWIPKVKDKKVISYIRVGEKPDTVIISENGKERLLIGMNGLRAVLSHSGVAYKHIRAVRQEMISWKFMQLNLEDLRLPTNKYTYRYVTGTISEEGKNLPEVLFRIKQEDQYAITAISRDLNNLLPNLVGIEVYYDEVMQQFVIEIEDDDKRKFSLERASEGALRLLVLLVLQYDSQQTGTLFFENPENGIDPSLSEELEKLLKKLSVDFEDTEIPLRQVIVNTHCKTLVNKEDKNITVFDFHNVSLLTTVKDRRVKLKVTSYAATH